LEVPAGRIVTLQSPWEETARLRPGQDSKWPIAVGRQGEPIDLRAVPGPAVGSHDDVYLTGLSDGWIAVTNPKLDLRFTMRFDQDLFPWVVSWQPYGGAEAMPLRGSYGLGIEPWSSFSNLEEAARSGTATEVGGSAQLRTEIKVSLEQPSGS